ncbi:hypothetical protein A7D00_3712 [Trichophyton violaceum]|uniref:Uncharacterized protein n=1 Tax=Trichophyton violaceum TaxID=34388 RepID=A0A178FJF2_TRIVO|nr:hypothetical protein A7D00_3712 [Trichophyton violaceum]
MTSSIYAKYLKSAHFALELAKIFFLIYLYESITGDVILPPDHTAAIAATASSANPKSNSHFQQDSKPNSEWILRAMFLSVMMPSQNFITVEVIHPCLLSEAKAQCVEHDDYMETLESEEQSFTESTTRPAVLSEAQAAFLAEKAVQTRSGNKDSDIFQASRGSSNNKGSDALHVSKGRSKKPGAGPSKSTPAKRVISPRSFGWACVCDGPACSSGGQRTHKISNIKFQLQGKSTRCLHIGSYLETYYRQMSEPLLRITPSLIPY